ncbi:bifunctional 4-hydroxy-3-methylbut-2-enyl diphosphate reductase/30S ribosomal protein S1 [Clostridium culturomicium]|uniref:bifunctional 4-hydroxy-3-methylbut-2-enyl diphosphate reductase/30S ribosomal protein S1 n=1 Tax=Clostridium culturomicium TaxID=1499683 RepID=UPI0018CC803C|nr:bifunctional 4-hydroxy-3-methylbut-2-enyl diphosphate reductase/30S ribosomal protein S1 [Clostridium culturomicium]
MMEVLLAEKAGFCFGVKRAVDEAVRLREKYDKPIHTLGPLIHNNDVVKSLEEKGIFPITLEEALKLKENDVVVIRSHGVGKKVIEDLNSIGVIIENGTCPYVKNIQQKVEEYYNKGYNIIIVGDESHPEVIGINGWCNDSAIISKDGSNIDEISRKVCVVSQTTEKQSNWEKVLGKVISLSKEVVAFNTICNATEERQGSADELSKEVDMMIVLGGFNSSNTTKLYEICKKNCENTYHAEKLDSLLLNMIRNDKINKIGITAGASTPEYVIEEAINKMKKQNNISQEDMDLYAQYSNDTTNISVGGILEGEVFKVNEKEAYLTIGAKSEAIIPAEEFSREDTPLTEQVKVGDVIKAKVINRKNTDGLVVLSRVEVLKAAQQQELKAAFENGTVLNVQVKEVVKGGLVALFKGERIFIPASHVELSRVADLSKYVGETMDVKVIEFSRDRNRVKIVGSRRELLEKDNEAKKEATWASLTQGAVMEGTVKRLAAFGAFVEVGGIDGLLHSSEMSWNKINNPSKLYKVGDVIKVVVLEADKENNKLALSVKSLNENPWNNIETKYPVGNVVVGKVARFAPFGAFVELEEGVDGLVHISQITKERVEKVENVLKIGETIKAVITQVDGENKKIGLSIKDVDAE